MEGCIDSRAINLVSGQFNHVVHLTDYSIVHACRGLVLLIAITVE